MLSHVPDAGGESATLGGRVRWLVRSAVIVVMWLMACYLILSVLVSRLLPSESLEPWPMGNVVLAMVALYAPVGIASFLVYRFRNAPTGTQILLHAGAIVILLSLLLLPFGA